MYKIIILIFSIVVSLNAVDYLKSLSQLKEDKIAFLAFEKNGCPWCVQYRAQLESGIEQKYKENISFFKVKKGSEVYSQLRKKLGVKIIIYPMTYIIRLNTKREYKIISEIYGYQTEEYLEELFHKEVFTK